MHNMHLFHAAQSTHEMLKKDEERRKEIVRKAKEKNWPGFAGAEKKAEKTKEAPEKTEAKSAPGREKEPAQRQGPKLHPHHRLLLSHFAKKFGAKKGAEK